MQIRGMACSWIAVPARLGLLGAALLGLAPVGCATGPDPILSTGGKVPPDIDRSLRCPRGTGIVFGRIAGVQTSAWCERLGPAGPSGVKHGPFVEWYDSLQKKNVGLYEEGLRQGPWRFYLPSGQLESEVIYEHGNVVPQTPAPTATTTAPAATTGAVTPTTAPATSGQTTVPSPAPASATTTTPTTK